MAQVGHFRTVGIVPVKELSWKPVKELVCLVKRGNKLPIMEPAGVRREVGSRRQGRGDHTRFLHYRCEHPKLRWKS